MTTADQEPVRVCLLGATGTIGRAGVEALMRRGYEVTCLVRPRTKISGTSAPKSLDRLREIAGVKEVDLADSASLRSAFEGQGFSAVVSCMASRSGAPADAWAVDYRAQSAVLAAAKEAGVDHFVLLSAICVQKPLLAFQHAKLAFEAELAASGMRYSIVRATAFFKSLSGQIERVRRGKAFLLFGDGTLTACKPISDRDLAEYLADCLDDESKWNRILPIGGPGRAITPREQGEALFAMLGRPPKFRSVPVGFFNVVVGILGTLGRVVPSLAAKAELARIGRYYAAESMLVLDQQTGRYDPAATPSTGRDTLFGYYQAVIDGTATLERGDHAVF
ncbi:MAG: NAD(P)H-binding protein [Allopontixanthobacter sediminis]